MLIGHGAGDASARGALQETLRGGHRFEQLALAEFIDSGQFSRHLGRMRRLYRHRQELLRMFRSDYKGSGQNTNGDQP